jgi:hypothetical protein
VTSSPLRSRRARPIAKASPGGCTGGTGIRLRRRNTGPSIAAAARTASAVSAGSAGTMTVMPAMARVQARSSIEWCVGPSSPYASPLDMPHSFTLWRL